METKDYIPFYKKSHALVIGINSYANSSLSTLGSAEADAQAIADLLGSPKYGFGVDILIGNQATKTAIQKSLYDLRGTDFNDRVVFYFAGHGYTLTDNFGREKGYLATVDTIPNQEFTALGLDEVTSLSRFGGAKHMGFIFDACFSGQALGLTRSPQTSIERNITAALQKYMMRRAYQVLSAGAGDQTVDDYPSMTTFIIKALKDESSNSLRESVTFNNLGLYLQQTIAADLGKTQIPQFGSISGSQGGDFIFWARDYKLIGSENPSSVFALKSLPSKKQKSDFQELPAFTAEIDLSGRIEDFLSPTVITISAGLSNTVWISGPEKQKVASVLRRLKSHWGSTRINVYLYSMLLLFVLKDHIRKLDEVFIDIEYQGYESQIKSFLLETFRKNGLPISKGKLKITHLQKNSLAKIMAAKIYKGVAEPDSRITADDLFNQLTKM